MIHFANFDQEGIKEFDAPSVVSKLSRKKIGTPFGNKWIAPYLAGWGATCYHENEGDMTTCKKTFQDRSMSNEEICTRIKMWYLMGESIDQNAMDARTQHRQMNDHETSPLLDPELIEQCAG